MNVLIHFLVILSVISQFREVEFILQTIRLSHLQVIIRNRNQKDFRR